MKVGGYPCRAPTPLEGVRRPPGGSPPYAQGRNRREEEQAGSCAKSEPRATLEPGRRMCERPEEGHADSRRWNVPGCHHTQLRRRAGIVARRLWGMASTTRRHQDDDGGTYFGKRAMRWRQPAQGTEKEIPHDPRAQPPGHSQSGWLSGVGVVCTAGQEKQQGDGDSRAQGDGRVPGWLPHPHVSRRAVVEGRARWAEGEAARKRHRGTPRPS